MTSLVATLLIGVLLPASSPGQVSDVTKIRALEERQGAAWNAHDINAYSDLFTRDAQVVNVLGWHWKSRGELQQKLGRAFQSVFAHSQIRFEEPTIDFLKADVAVAHVRWTMSGAQNPAGTGTHAPEMGIQTQVLVKEAGTWKIAHFQNTNSVPEQPFPTRSH